MRDDLYQLLETAQREQQSGTVHIFGKADGGQQYYVIVLDQGEASYIGRSSRPEAVPLAAVLGMEITGVRFSLSRRNWTSNVPLPDMQAILNQIKTQHVNGNGRFSATAPTPPPKPLPPRPLAAATPPLASNGQKPSKGNLRIEAVNILQKIYGRNAYQLVADVSRRFSPEQYPKAFIDGCVEQAHHAVGPDMAKSMFQPLYDQLG